ncbi:hypothetical protein QE152_g33 [Popillia japonica]|uniref:Gustatory receptor n=1 Tax=Popillia japonica TaxID=7064 RepID=A0AAW1NCT3_POPJA
MVKPPHKIASTLKPILALLRISGLSPLKFDSNYTVKAVTTNTRFYCTMYDTILTIALFLCGGTSIWTDLNSTWITIVHALLLFFRVSKVIIWNIRRWKHDQILINVWKRLTINETPYFKHGVHFDVNYVTFWGLATIVINVCLKTVYITLFVTDGDNQSGAKFKRTIITVFTLAEVPMVVICARPFRRQLCDVLGTSNDSNQCLFENCVYNFISEVPMVVICAEYLTYCLILREYFIKIETAFTKMITKRFIVQGKNDVEYIKMINTGYFSVCDVSKNMIRVLSASTVIMILEDLAFITVHVHNLISKSYAGKISEYWFFDYKYSVLLLAEHCVNLFLVIVPTHLLMTTKWFCYAKYDRN